MKFNFWVPYQKIVIRFFSHLLPVQGVWKRPLSWTIGRYHKSWQDASQNQEYTKVKVDGTVTVLVYINPVLTHLLGTVSHVLWPWGIRFFVGNPELDLHLWLLAGGGQHDTYHIKRGQKCWNCHLVGKRSHSIKKFKVSQVFVDVLKILGNMFTVF